MAPVLRLLALAGALYAVLAGTAAEPAVLVGAIGTLVVAWAVAREVAAVLPVLTGTGPVVAARDHHRALARRPVPRHRDPDAPGHTRSRAPSELLPAV
ncbi:DUF6412 domain-containing protein [Pseudonocardia cypriaca]|jgi:hypothetical protein|uniref:Uncharacterized protein n=1 Tax=Pseudonocardia cypriaca TaxID=882449 RepID=A0A543GE55_9PSEU|nr:DUF6412 domain-containing protein [Pseudonocardia cypriaca]TQM44362.1 hypothetical protein FB388_1727 [Pseudonocardia cypriaca]